MFPHFPKLHFFVYCMRSIEMLLLGLGEFLQDDISAGECLKSLDITEKEKPFVLPMLLFIGAMDSCLPFFVFPHVSSHFPDFFPHVFLCLFCFAPNRHTYAQFVLWWLQARAVCEAFIWSCDQVGVLLCQHRVRLWRALPTLPTTKLWYRYSSHSTLYTYGATSCWLTHTQTHTV